MVYPHWKKYLTKEIMLQYRKAVDTALSKVFRYEKVILEGDTSSWKQIVLSLVEKALRKTMKQLHVDFEEVTPNIVLSAAETSFLIVSLVGRLLLLLKARNYIPNFTEKALFKTLVIMFTIDIMCCVLMVLIRKRVLVDKPIGNVMVSALLRTMLYILSLVTALKITTKMSFSELRRSLKSVLVSTNLKYYTVAAIVLFHLNAVDWSMYSIMVYPKLVKEVSQ